MTPEARKALIERLNRSYNGQVKLHELLGDRSIGIPRRAMDAKEAADELERLAQFEKDALRLTWLEENPDIEYYAERQGDVARLGVYWMWTVCRKSNDHGAPWDGLASGLTLRAAIDSAIAAEQKSDVSR